MRYAIPIRSIPRTERHPEDREENFESLTIFKRIIASPPKGGLNFEKNEKRADVTFSLRLAERQQPRPEFFILEGAEHRTLCEAIRETVFAFYGSADPDYMSILKDVLNAKPIEEESTDAIAKTGA